MCIGGWLVGVFLCLSGGNKNIHILFPFPLPLQPVGIQSRIRFLSVFMLCLKIGGLVLFVSFCPPCQHRVSPTSPGRAFCLLPAQASTKLAARSRGCFKCGVPPPLHPSLHPRSMSPNSRTSVPSKILLSGLPSPSYSFMCP